MVEYLRSCLIDVLKIFNDDDVFVFVFVLVFWVLLPLKRLAHTKEEEGEEKEIPPERL